MTKYTITVTENQARLIAQALDLVSRLQMGQWSEFIDWLPHQRQFCRHNLREQIQPIMSEHFRKTKPEGCQYAIDGWGGHYGVYSEFIPDTARVAWDLQKVIEHRLAWDRQPEGGFTVDFDGPRHVGGEPLAKIVKEVQGGD